MDKTFPTLTRECFRFLTDDYSFTVKEKLYGTQPYSGGEIEFRSPSTALVVSLDRDGMSARLGPSSEPEIGWLSVESIVERYSHGMDNSLLNLPDRSAYTMEDWVQLRIGRYASAVRKYCVPFLEGDFSEWLELQRWLLKKMQDQYRALSGRDLPENEKFSVYIRSKGRSAP